MNLVPFVLYFCAFVGYSLHFARRTAISARLATTMLAAATLAHTFIIGMRTMEVGQVPVFDATSAISMFVWLLAVAYLYTEVTTEERTMGVFILPLIVALQLIPAFKTTAKSAPQSFADRSSACMCRRSCSRMRASRWPS